MALDTPTPDQQILQDNTGLDNQDPNVVPPPSPEEIQAQQDKAKSDEDARQEELDRLLLVVVKNAEKEDEDLRYNMLRDCKRNDLYFNNIQKIFYDSVAHDVRSLDSLRDELQLDGLDDIKTVNIYRAFAESLIAATTVTAPNVGFTPDDADDPDDVETAETYGKIADFISRHNHAPLMLVKGATIAFNCGTLFGYNYFKSDPAYGVVRKPTGTTQVASTSIDLRCRACSTLIDSGIPEGVDVSQLKLTCPTCGLTDIPVPFSKLSLTEEVTSWEDTPKGRSGFDLFGPTNVKVSLYARNQATMGYLILRLEDSLARLKSIYSDFADDIVAGGGDTQSYERWARIPLQYEGTIPTKITTLRTAWLRPWYFYTLDLEEDVDTLLQEYPDGVMVSVIGEVIVEKKHEKLDDRWTVSFDPRANFIHAEPAGNALVPMQDSETDIFNLGLQSIEFGIPETFVHPKTLNISQYSKQRNNPGMMTQAMPPSPGAGLADGFHTVKTATLSNEYTTFAASLTQKTQFVTGAFPSIFGGADKGGGGTATEYTESRSRALQRLQLTWQMLSIFWTQLIYKCVKDYADNLLEDEQFSKKENGTFVNVFIKKSGLNGKVGEVEPEINGQLPQSWAQKKDFFMSLLGMQNPEIGPILLHPNNSENIKLITGMPDFYIPGENDRNKQYTEYYELSIGVPTPGQPDPLSGQPGPNQPSVMVDIDVDDHAVHMLVLKNILVSLQGLQLYRDNPDGYNNCIAHYRQHELAQQAKTQAPSGLTAPGEQAQSAAKTTQG